MAQGKTYQNTFADEYVRKKVIERVAPLLDMMLNKEIFSYKEIEVDFGMDYKTARKLRERDVTISFPTIRKFCYIIGHYLDQEIKATEAYRKHVTEREEWLTMLHQMQQEYLKIYGLQAEIVMDLIAKNKDLPRIVREGTM